MTNRVDKYIKIVPQDIDPKRYKTKKWFVLGRDGGIIGEIYWYGGWRKYVFEVYNAHDFFDWDFMQMVADFCEIETKKQLEKL